MTQTSRRAHKKLTIATEKKHRHSPLKSPFNSLSALAMTLLFLSGTAIPVIAQTKQATKLTAQTAQKEAIQKETFAATPYIDQLTESAQLETGYTDATLEADIEQIVAQMIATETQHWSAAEKSALQTMDSLRLKDNELAEIATFSAADLRTKMKTDKKLAQLNAVDISSEEALKLAPTLLLSRYLLNIGRAAVWGGVVTAIRSADFDYRALGSALTSGDTQQFMSLLGEGLTGQTSFLNLMSSAATFACGSATLDFTPGLCDRFSSGVQKIFARVERGGNSREAQSESRRSRSSFFRRVRSHSSNQPKPIKD